jgi:hypothetical protein
VNTYRVHLITGKVFLVKRFTGPASIFADAKQRVPIDTETGPVLFAPEHIVFIEIVNYSA